MSDSATARAFRAVSGVLVVVGISYWILRPDPGGDQDRLQGFFLPDPQPAPTFALTSQDGREVTSTDFPGKILVVFFGYTFCPDVCPLTLSNLSKAVAQMGAHSDRVQVLFISVDPERDTPPRLAGYLRAFDPRFVGLTGTEAKIRDVANSFGVYYAKHGTGDQYTIDHTARTYVIDRNGMIPLTFPVSAAPEEMVLALNRLLKEDR